MSSTDYRPSDYIDPLSYLVSDPYSTRVILYCRASTQKQRQRGSIKDQKKVLRLIAEKCGLEVVGDFSEVKSGKTAYRDSSSQLHRAIEKCAETDAFLLAESTCRLIRAQDFHHSNNINAVPSKAEFEELATKANGVKLATLFDPDASFEEIRSNQTKRSHRCGKNKGGRPKKTRSGDKTRRRVEKRPDAICLSELGASVREIGNYLNVPSATVQDWLKKFGDNSSCK